MKLLKPAGCSFPSGGGNVKERTMIVEEQGIGFWTGVRFPSGPLKNSARRNALALFFYDRVKEDVSYVRKQIYTTAYN